MVYMRASALQVVQERLFGMRQSNAQQWIHVLLPALLVALRTLRRLMRILCLIQSGWQRQSPDVPRAD